jgi:hypothetical protein
VCQVEPIFPANAIHVLLLMGCCVSNDVHLRLQDTGGRAHDVGGWSDGFVSAPLCPVARSCSSAPQG